jgi:hypothetical protein
VIGIESMSRPACSMKDGKVRKTRDQVGHHEREAGEKRRDGRENRVAHQPARQERSGRGEAGGEAGEPSVQLEVTQLPTVTSV